MKPRRKRLSLAKQSNKFELYEEAVQNTEWQLDFFIHVYQEYRGLKPIILREDFCGTAAFCHEWVKSDDSRIAYGLDIDPEPLKWSMESHTRHLGSQARNRCHLVQSNVLTASLPEADITCACNFSYYIFKTRDLLRTYFIAARRSLNQSGLLILDAFGGYESHDDVIEERECEGFKYLWEHNQTNYITGEIQCHIHFEFPDGSKMPYAFNYDWRLWTLPEIIEILKEAGFSSVDIYWECVDDDTGEGNGEFKKTQKVAGYSNWVSYLVAIP